MREHSAHVVIDDHEALLLLVLSSGPAALASLPLHPVLGKGYRNTPGALEEKAVRISCVRECLNVVQIGGRIPVLLTSAAELPRLGSCVR
ncbi:hypothetical protein TPADAL_0791 [Treponema pallidum subsp. pallidum DAL-1]|uniref:Secreted protein n=1 Tax=Treponema pallidum subsp. pertenue (strain Gauthier) TaxID=491080 RepID=A0AAU8Q859_TREPG|nr:hypothetical protein TPESAMD_0791 [Treponema pallidum subsp. pertenue str. SamoaD]AEZ58990.1 hypothetical protein TPECDC2_0791 [Treponema pallidum subsp. pertenue str. CDC2]AEZ60058.1 hypothetical protein TPEGAU_0791 [Treponema pallidum subsp. pertenue str. Gauthier]AEZ61118.1 hypothetical protein TPADAL_0791 [Treponema pallidum subsp. pallidum DAL-1]AGK84442.1 hypothetical protein TPFB_0791 [Treponema pallidum str. Fribourg-Blanc]ANI43954.1 hypothetical protein SD24_03930 [Treponema pallid